MKWYAWTIIVLATVLSSCKTNPYNDIHVEADHRLSTMKSPVVLIGKYKTMGCWSATLKDSAGRIESFGNLTILGQSIGESRHIGDTIK